MFTWPFTALSFPICCPSLLFRKWQARKQSKLREGENQHINRMIQTCSSRYLNVRMLLELEYLWVFGCSDRTTHLKSLTISPKDALPHRIPLNFHQLSSPPHLLLICPAYLIPPFLTDSLPPSPPFAPITQNNRPFANYSANPPTPVIRPHFFHLLSLSNSSLHHLRLRTTNLETLRYAGEK